MRGGGNHSGGRGGGGDRHKGGDRSKPKRDPILDLSKYADKRITVKFMGGREVSGLLKGYDLLLNLVLDETEEILKANNADQAEPATRQIGLLVCRGPAIITISPVDGSSVIANPYLTAES
ncbi:U6 snRNP-associated protein Lsm7 [Tieghemiomyces parasiticus]|uniref:U6 snRNP-associated protein Lsm7 n=1 Tax=Tieghemiomyces parasiticus TaxID=78921 RepID=A0A9W7ZZ39_9FUNG|nr:U6 snRNP-associated protein Lsm7 [Tieghemiomyces parasiticus]